MRVGERREIEWIPLPDSDPEDGDVRDRMARVCAELGKTQLAAMWRKAAAACRQTAAAPSTTGDVTPPISLGEP